MVNQIEQADIPLAGRGFCPRLGGRYAPGEYRRLSNLEISLEGTLKVRRPLKAITLNPGDTTGVPQTHGVTYVGHLNDRVMYVTADASASPKMEVSDEGYGSAANYRTLWGGNPIWSTTNYADLSHAKVVGFHRYGDKNYWVGRLIRSTVPISPVYGFIEVASYPANSGGDSDNPAYISTANPPPNRVVVSSSVIPGNPDPNINKLKADCEVMKTLIFKDRLWIATKRTLLYSKATDPTVWTSPDGGFIRLPGEEINDILNVGETLYILCDNAVYTLNYSSGDPAAGSLVKLASIGGDSLVSYEGVPYFSRSDALYSCESNRVNKVLDLYFNIVNDTRFIDVKVKLVVFRSYIIFIHQTWQMVDTTGVAAMGIFLRNYPTAVGYDQAVNPIVWLNMENGAAHQFEFKDQLGAAAETLNSGRIQDMYVVPWEDQYNRTVLYMRSGGLISAAGRWAGYGYYMLHDIDDYAQAGKWYDEVCDSSNNIINKSCEILAEIASFAPDGNEFYMKKFRSMMLEMDNSLYPLRYDFGFGDNFPVPWSGPAKIITAVDGAGQRRNPPLPYRVPINQRARSLTLIFSSPRADMPALFSEFPRFELNSLVVFWMPTGRAPVGKTVE